MASDDSVNHIRLSLCDLSLDEYDHNSLTNLRRQFDTLTDDAKDSLCESRQYLGGLEVSLKTCSYVPSYARKFLQHLIDNLEPESRDKVSEIYEPVSRSRYAEVDTRKQLLKLLIKWKDIIVEFGEVEANPFFLRNGSINPNFVEHLIKRNLSFAKIRPKGSAVLSIWGSLSPEQFDDCMCSYAANWSSYARNFKYEIKQPMLEEHISFGDAYSACFVVNPSASFPAPLQIFLM